ncbi:MAG: hypothetical protein ACRDOH_19085, partial [Streptosporangiaceae bacterium]
RRRLGQPGGCASNAPHYGPPRCAGRGHDVSRRMIDMLEHAQRCPSVSTAEALIEGYGIKGEHAEAVRPPRLRQ